MPFVFVVIGLVFLVSAIRGTQDALFTLVKSEFQGKGSFVSWAAAIMILGAIGYARPVRPIADAMIGLIILVMILVNKGNFFAQLNQGITSPVSPTVTPAASTGNANGTTANSAGAGNMPLTLDQLFPGLNSANTGNGPATGPGNSGAGPNILTTTADPIDI